MLERETAFFKLRCIFAQNILDFLCILWYNGNIRLLCLKNISIATLPSPPFSAEQIAYRGAKLVLGLAPFFMLSVPPITARKTTLGEVFLCKPLI